jgi:hypothetical protein
MVLLPDGVVARDEVHSYEAHQVGCKDRRIRRLLLLQMNQLPTYVLCVHEGGYEASLEPRKVYRALSDPAAEEHGLIRVIDESGEDCLFPARLFVPIAVPAEAEKAFSVG